MAVEKFTPFTLCKHRRFFITSSGRLGLDPTSMRPEDPVVVLRGGQWPFVLRKVAEDDYRLIGAAYVYGIMEGEAVEEFLGRNEPETIFQVR